jgi:hypothetical protein
MFVRLLSNLARAWRMFVEGACEAVLHAERAVLCAKAAFDGAKLGTSVGNSECPDSRPPEKAALIGF